MKQWDRPFWAIIALTLVVISCVILLTDRGTVENDAIQALSVARNILRGNGIATDIVYYPRHIQQDRIPAYQTTFPPGHPVLVAAVAAVTGWTVESAALLLCSVSFAVITPLLFVLLRNASGKPFTSFLLSLLWLSLSEAWISVALLNTDIVFIAFTVLSAMCLYLGERANWDKQNSAQDLMWCVLAGVFAGLAFSVRYAGLFLIAAGGVTLGLEFLRRPSRAGFSRIAGFALPAGISVVFLFARNNAIVGSWSGGNDQGIGRPIPQIARNLYHSVVTLTGVNLRWIRDGEPAAICFAVGCCLFGLFLLARPRGMPIVLRRMLQKRKRFVVFAFAYGTITVAALIYLELTASSVLRARLLLALVPFGMIASARLIRCIELQPGRKRQLGIVSVLCLLGGILLGQWHVPAIDYLPNAGNISQAQAQLEQLTTRNGSVLPLLQTANYEHPLISNRAHVLGQALNRPVVALASSAYVATNWPESDVKRLADQFNAEFLVDWDDSGESSVLLDQLRDGKSFTWLEEIARANGLHVYRILRNE